jgi:hypothetical protein
MSDEVPLGGGWSVDGVVRVGVVRVGDTVGFDAAPRRLGLDERGRDVLTFLDRSSARRRRSAV